MRPCLPRTGMRLWWGHGQGWCPRWPHEEPLLLSSTLHGLAFPQLWAGVTGGALVGTPGGAAHGPARRGHCPSWEGGCSAGSPADPGAGQSAAHLYTVLLCGRGCAPTPGSASWANVHPLPFSRKARKLQDQVTESGPGPTLTRSHRLAALPGHRPRHPPASQPQKILFDTKY